MNNISFPKTKPWRSEKHRRLVASLPCVVTGRHGPSQCGHVNFNKGMGTKACDSLTFPISPDAHREHDQGGNLTREERWRREWEYVDATRALLIQRNQWSVEAETAYKIAIQPLARVVHADREAA
ncbi:DUF968 domain-containing protein [Allopusillimonas ginsengisoli]|uniref:DUF968 domain-containing protein n=1 Tax=Allopusillimonas ginsengisoli TaxID=453575 RepID=UPI001021CCF7|nr:DUF968 domain-containing protein [Allopusillimonas ginsengisoli]TEA78660.1 DUF968 domain-containing protein [Allopusillimonas ginsengisoli]